ncbi:MAG TPA: hypothetical protein VEC06_20210 [Paucimonas sp.]|nr:hypothetical protein [Paucimonas sp.]
MKLELEFIHRSPVPWFGLAFLAAAALWSASLGVAWSDLHTTARRNQERIDKLVLAVKEKRRAAEQNQAHADPMRQQRLADRARVLRSLNYPWNRVLSTLEQTNGNDVAILSFMHDRSTGETQMSAEALDVAALTRFVESMNDGNPDGRWYLAHHQTQSQTNPPTIRASISNAASRAK